MKRAVYAGSFDPFTNGHLEIATESAKIFDEVYILLADNSAKKRRTDLGCMEALIRRSVAGYDNIHVDVCAGLIADYCRDNRFSCLIRGLRNTSDYLYEENIAKINQEINPQLRTVYLRASHEVVSSSMVWELHTNGKSVQKYLPYPEEQLRCGQD